MTRTSGSSLAGAIALLALAGAPVRSAAGADTEALAKQLANPVASLISVPFQSNWDFGFGLDDDGWQYKANVQPVIPFSLSEDWNLISRTILPVVFQKDLLPIPGNREQVGLGDTVQSLFLSPARPGPLGVIWGAGPVLLLPTATDDLLGADQWGAGPTVVALKQAGPWTVGALANHIWSVAGGGDHLEVSVSFLQPFVSYTTKRATSFTVNTESTYDWHRNYWTVPVNAGVSQVLRIGGQLVQVGLQGRWYAERPLGGPDWGLRIPIVLLFPR